ncbi:DUF58 domain-containing protein [Candidatus Woesearchaeota archaeon]|nr:MAG: DUF58 domain-containing protein [Candidatus Woesearchaeota archaeon]
MAEKRKVNIQVTPIVKKIEALTKRLVQTKVLGEYISVFKGAGLEFDGFKHYTPDMDASQIDWKASVRAKELLVQKYREVRELEVYFLLDVSNSMIFGSTEKLKNEFAGEFLLAMTYTILTAGDSVGIILFSDHIVHKINASKGTTQFYRIARFLTDPTIYGGGYDLVGAADFTLGFVKKKNSVVILLTDFLGLNKTTLWQKKLKLMAAKFDFVSVIIKDPRDIYLPEGIGEVMVEDPYTGDRLMIDSDLLRERYLSYTKKQDKEFIQFFEQNNIDYMQLMTDKDYIQSMFEFFNVRKSKIK